MSVHAPEEEHGGPLVQIGRNAGFPLGHGARADPFGMEGEIAGDAPLRCLRGGPDAPAARPGRPRPGSPPRRAVPADGPAAPARAAARSHRVECVR